MMAAPPRRPDAGAPPVDQTVPFWRKPLEALSPPEWESLCDGCGKCCLVKLEDEDTGAVHFTDVGCRLLDAGTCRCSNYPARQTIVPDCIKLTPAIVRSVPWLPRTCAYRLVAEGQDLPSWHPLKTGFAESVHEAGISTRGRLGASELDVDVEDLPDHIVTWPMRGPRRRRSDPGV